MEILQITAESKSTEAVSAESAGEYGRCAESDCARALAQLESVLRETSPMKLQARRAGRQLKNEKRDEWATINGIKPYTHSHRAAVQFGVFDLGFAKPIPDPLSLDQGLDFVVHDDGAIELTPTGFRRMAQAHSAGLDVVIGVDWPDVLRLPVRMRDAVDASPRNENQRGS
jgi:hypothetical protein